MNESNIELSIVVAAFNEGQIIEKNIGRIIEELNTRPDIKWEIICVNDGSEDNTGEILDRVKSSTPNLEVIHHRRNFGQGRALRNAFDICKGKVIITLDADLSYKTEYIYKLYDTLQETKSDIVLASAYMEGGEVKNVPFIRHLLSKSSNIYLARITGQRLFTSTCVVRAYQREVIDSLILTSDGMDLQIEILVKASTMGFRISEIPATLEWESHKKEEEKEGKKKKRSSKMNIINTIYTYSLLGWLHRPASVFLVLSWLLILPGLYMAITIIIVAINMMIENSYLGFGSGLQKTLMDVVHLHSQNITFVGIFLGFGMLIFAFSLVLVQNKRYYDELSRMIQRSQLK
jgi:glycosyltransferase involved in cell wall biosynthesis